MTALQEKNSVFAFQLARITISVHIPGSFDLPRLLNADLEGVKRDALYNDQEPVTLKQ